MSQFCSATEFATQFYDLRRVGDWPTNDNTRATSAELVNPATAAGAIVLMMLQSSAETIVSAATVGKRYTREILDGMVGNGGVGVTTPSGWILKKMNADLAFGQLVERRALPPEQTAAIAPAYGAALTLLEQFRRGDRIFADIEGVMEAGLPTTASMTPRPPQNPTWTQLAGRFHGCTPTALNNPPSPWPYNYGPYGS